MERMLTGATGTNTSCPDSSSKDDFCYSHCLSFEIAQVLLEVMSNLYTENSDMKKRHPTGSCGIGGVFLLIERSRQDDNSFLYLISNDEHLFVSLLSLTGCSAMNDFLKRFNEVGLNITIAGLTDL